METLKTNYFNAMFVYLIDAGFKKDMISGQYQYLKGSATALGFDSDIDKQDSLDFTFAYIVDGGAKIELSGKHLAEFFQDFPAIANLFNETASKVIEELKFIKPLTTLQLKRQQKKVRQCNIEFVENRYVTGLLFVDNFANIINEFMFKECAMPQKFMKILDSLYKVSLKISKAKVSQDVLARQQQKQVEIKILQQINDITHGRCEEIVRFLNLLETGQNLTYVDERIIETLKSKFDEEKLLATEKALPFLIFVVNTTIANTRQAELMKSFYSQVVKGRALSEKQLAVVRNIYNMLKIEFYKLPKLQRLMSVDLLAMLKRGDETLEVTKVLVSRGIKVEPQVATYTDFI